MTNEEWKLFEIGLVKQYKDNPSPEIAEALIKEYAAHKFNESEVTPELQKWIDQRIIESSKDLTKMDKAFGLVRKKGRPDSEKNYVSMNANIWKLIFEGLPIGKAYEKTADVFATTVDNARIGFERKDTIGKRHLARFGLDMFIVQNKRELSSDELIAANKILKEEVGVQMMKDLIHNRAHFDPRYPNIEYTYSYDKDDDSI